jgi:hypothetical protein
VDSVEDLVLLRPVAVDLVWVQQAGLGLRNPREDLGRRVVSGPQRRARLVEALVGLSVAPRFLQQPALSLAQAMGRR